ncbi:MAG: hypothetical protein R3293_05860 [Candidatus Promineifilaceae bacterium]|nr:hypothetical protein [Candidatus Promineifilaceae bacterium]
MNEEPLEIGRVLRASTIGFSVGCRVNQLSVPGFGGLVKAQPADSREEIYGLIYNINIDDDQLIRRLVMIESPRPEVIEDQRRNRLLPIEMSVLAIGYQRNEQLTFGLPPRPPLNLDPVIICRDQDEVTRITNHLGYLRLILRAADSNVPVDQLLVAHIRDVYLIRDRDVDWVRDVVRELIEPLRSNYDILIPTLESLSDAVPDLEMKV